MPRRVVWAHAGIFKADQIAEITVPEDHAHLMAVLAPFIGAVCDINTRVAVERARQYSVVAGRPSEAGLSRQREGLIGNRALRRPQTNRRDPQFLQDVAAGIFQLLAR